MQIHAATGLSGDLVCGQVADVAEPGHPEGDGVGDPAGAQRRGEVADDALVEVADRLVFSSGHACNLVDVPVVDPRAYRDAGRPMSRIPWRVPAWQDAAMTFDVAILDRSRRGVAPPPAVAHVEGVE